MQTKATAEEVQPATVEDYSGILEDQGFEFIQSAHYYRVGTSDRVQGWILHLSCEWIKIPELLKIISPILKEYNIPFKVAQNSDVAAELSNGGLGYHQQGKVFCLYPPKDDLAEELVREIFLATTNFRGCNVPTDFHLGGIVYTRYGSFSPQLILDQDSNVVRYIQDANGQLVLDEYHTPFRFPKDIAWPFSNIAEPIEQVPSTFLKDSYKIYTTLKTDAKGRVMRSLRLKGLKVEWVVIKEAKHGVFVDLYERDIQDRLQWQHELLTALEHKISVPKVYDYFTENGNTYMVMENIKGKALDDIITKVYESTIWYDLDIYKRQGLIDDFLKLVLLVHAMHKEGYVHRDINTMNFLKDRKGQVVAIDLELAFSLKENKPKPPFTLGTAGFTSPEQQRLETPKTNQDVYSLGAIMIKFFTNLSPYMFYHDDPNLYDDLNFFVQDGRISRLITRCLSQDAENRPRIEKIESCLEEVRNSLTSGGYSLNKVKERVEPTIKSLICALATNTFVDPSGIWFSKPLRNSSLANHRTERIFRSGLYVGVSGPLYTLARAKNLGYDLEVVKAVYSVNWKYLYDYFLTELPNVLPGLYHGSAGIAMTIAKGIEAGLIGEEHRSFIEKCLELRNPLVDLAAGIAGQGIAILKCSGLMETGVSNRLLQSHVGNLLQQQQKDGSWVSHLQEGGKPACFTGLAQGSAGICLFLLEYFEKHRDPSVEQAVQQSLKWLQHQARKTRTGIFWRVNNRTKKVSLGLNEGSAGIALCFIKAYDLLGHESYRQTAEKALAHYTKHFVTENLTTGGGITGLGIVYLEALRVLGDEEWKERVDFIFSTLVHSARNSGDTRHWIVDRGLMQTADLMTGNSGILHFLLNYASPGKGSFL